MPPESLPPWDRKGETVFRERKHGYGHGHGHHNTNIGAGGRGRGGRGFGGPVRRSYGSRNSSEFSPRWGISSEFRRPPGAGKQGEWNLFQEDSPHGYPTPRTGDRFMDDDCFRPSGPHGNGRYGSPTPRAGDRFLDDDYFRPSGSQGNGRYGRNYRDNRNGFGRKEWRGRSWENNQQYNGSANTSGRPPSINDQRSVGNSPVRPSHESHPNFDPRPQSHSKDQADKTVDANGSGVSQRINKENLMGTLDWKPVKWSRSGSLASRGSGFSHSSGSKSTGGESCDVKDELAPKNVTPVQSPSGDVAACAPSAVPSEETGSRKKPRIGWGEGLAKYEKKIVEAPEKNATKFENTVSVPTHPVTSNSVDKSPKNAGLSDCSSPATPSSFGCSSSPGLEAKSNGKITDGDSNNFSVSSMSLPENQTEGMQFSLEKLELNSIANLGSLLNELLNVDEQFSTESGFMRSSAFSKLLLWKGDISKTLELTEVEIDSLENELKLMKGDSGEDVQMAHCDNKDDHCDGPNGFVRPLALEVVSSEDTLVENTLPSHYTRGNHTESKDEDIDCPSPTTSKKLKPFFAQRPVSPCGWKNSSSEDNVFDKSSGIILENLLTSDKEETTEGAYCQGGKREYNICDIILASNKETSSKASEMLTKLLPSDKPDNSADGMKALTLSCLPADATIKEKLSRRKRLLKFKERVISLKYRTFYHLWRKDLSLLSLRSQRTKPQKKLDVTSRTMQTGNQKHRLAIHARFDPPAGSSSVGLSTEILNFTRKLLLEPELKIYRSSLKMPAMVLDEKDKMSSMFMSSNGLVEDPCAVEKERVQINPWTIEEKEIFMEKLTTFGKDFRKIASFLDHKTIADCIQFYYKNHKSESFEKTKKPDVKKRAKPLSSDTYLLTSEKKWDRDMNSASLDILGAVSVIAAQADQAMKTSKVLSGKLSNKKPRGLDAVIETPEAMSSCITNSVGPTDGNRERKRQKVGSFVRRRLTPLNVVDDDDSSDESCGEMDPADWTDDEKSLFVRAFSVHGKDFLTISRFVRTKTRDECKIFFSKARKCLGLETLHPGSFSGGLLGSNNTNGSGSDVETGSVGCSDKSGSRMEEDLPHASPDVSKPNCGPGQSDCKDTDMEADVPCPGDILADVSDLGPGGVADVRDNRSVEIDDDTQRIAHLINQDDTSKAHAAVDDITGGSPHVPSVMGSETVSDATGPHDQQCKQSGHFESEVLTGLPVDLSFETELSDDITHKPGCESEAQCSQEYHFRKCSHSDTEKPSSSSGDVKLFGKSLSKPSPLEKATLSPQRYYETTKSHLTYASAENDHNGFVGLENVPVRNYGVWDGSKIKVVSYPPSIESPSAFLLAKYPDAFANRNRSVQVPVSSGECNQNNACEFSPTEYSNGSGSFVDYPTLKSRIGVPSPYTLDFKQRHNALPELQKATSSLHPQRDLLN